MLRCMFFDKQLIRLQETPDEVPEGCIILYSNKYSINYSLLPLEFLIH